MPLCRIGERAYIQKGGSMRRFLPLIILCTILAGAAPGFSDIFIVFSSGTSSVDLFGNGNWTDAEVDMELRMQSVIRTGPDGAVEIDLDGDHLYIGANRYTIVGELLGKVERKKKVGFLKGLKKYTKQMGSVTTSIPKQLRPEYAAIKKRKISSGLMRVTLNRTSRIPLRRG